MKTKIQTAFVLAAGFGTRLRPYTLTLPKPLLQVCGKPLILRIFDKLINAGITRIIINTHYLPHRFSEFFEQYRQENGKTFYRGIEIEAVFEPVILDTGGGLKNIIPLLHKDESVLVYNGDIDTKADIPALLETAQNSNDAEAVLCLRREGELKNVGVANGKVCDMRFTLKTAVDENAQFTGIFVAKPKFFERLKIQEKKVFSSVEIFLDCIKSNKNSLYAHFDPNHWDDIGNTLKYETINKDFDIYPQLIEAKARDINLKPKKISRIAKGASVRAFYKLEVEDTLDCVACFYSSEKKENFLYADLANFLYSQGFPVPKIYLHSPEERIIIMESAGNQDLLSIENSEQKLSLYFKAVEEIAKLHTTITKEYLRLTNPLELSEAFGENLYNWEHSYFFEECVRGKFGINSNKPVEEFEYIKNLLSKQPQCLLHRDLQSQNIMINENESVSFIDFQGMRFGCAFYDVGSLLFDPYVNLDNAMRESIFKKYLYCANLEDSDSTRKLFYTASAQRLMQALGAYGFLSEKRKRKEYEAYIKPALLSLILCTKKCGLTRIQEIAKMCLDKC